MPEQPHLRHSSSDELAALGADRDSWRRVAESLQREKIDMHDRIAALTAAGEDLYDCVDNPARPASVVWREVVSEDGS